MRGWRFSVRTTVSRPWSPYVPDRGGRDIMTDLSVEQHAVQTLSPYLDRLLDALCGRAE